MLIRIIYYLIPFLKLTACYYTLLNCYVKFKKKTHMATTAMWAIIFYFFKYFYIKLIALKKSGMAKSLYRTWSPDKISWWDQKGYDFVSSILGCTDKFFHKAAFAITFKLNKLPTIRSSDDLFHKSEMLTMP